MVELNELLSELNEPIYYKKGLEYFITDKNIKIKSKKDLDKAVQDYNKMKIGE